MDLLESLTPLGDILIEDGVISKAELAMALAVQEPSRRTGQLLVDKGVMSMGIFKLMLEVQLVEILVDLGYADEEEIYGPLHSHTIMDSQVMRNCSITGS